MVFGIPVTGTMMLIGGVVLFVMVSFETLLGLRIIKLGKRHRIVHRWTAFTIVAVASVHGLLGLAFTTEFRIG